MRIVPNKRWIFKRWTRRRSAYTLGSAILILCCVIVLVIVHSLSSPDNSPVTSLFLPSQPTASNTFGWNGSFPSHNAANANKSTGLNPSVNLTPTHSAVVLHPSGQTIPGGDITGWHQIFAEDFNTNVPLGQFPGKVYGNKFAVYADKIPDTAGQQGGNSEYYPSKVVSVSNGALNLYLHTENGRKMAAAILPILPGNHRYGKYTVRFRSDAVAGFKTAWLLWPDSENWPNDGELDFPENNLTSTINGFVHHQGATSGADQTIFNSTATDTSWHTTSIEWSPGKVTFILDGAVLGTSTTRIPDQAMHWVLQTESCLVDCSSTTASGNLQVDWVTAYSMT